MVGEEGDNLIIEEEMREGGRLGLRGRSGKGEGKKGKREGRLTYEIRVD